MGPDFSMFGPPFERLWCNFSFKLIHDLGIFGIQVPLLASSKPLQIALRNNSAGFSGR